MGCGGRSAALGPQAPVVLDRMSPGCCLGRKAEEGRGNNSYQGVSRERG